MQTVTVTVAVEGGGSVAATLPAGDVLYGLVIPGMQAQDDGEWSWDMQESEPDRLRAIESFTRSAYDLLYARANA